MTLQIQVIMTDIDCVFESMSDRGSIYISNLPAAQSLPLLKKLKIKAILSCAKSAYLNHTRQDVPYYSYIPAEDHQNYDLKHYFQQTYEFLEKARKQTNVLVHCIVGVSRSVTIVIAYLLKKYKYNLPQVISLIQRKRKKINPNKGFLQQLKHYAQQQGIKCEEEITISKRKSPLKNRSFSANKFSHEETKMQDKIQTHLHKKLSATANSSSKCKENKEVLIEDIKTTNICSYEQQSYKNPHIQDQFQLTDNIQILSHQKKTTIQLRINKIRQKLFKSFSPNNSLIKNTSSIYQISTYLPKQQAKRQSKLTKTAQTFHNKSVECRSYKETSITNDHSQECSLKLHKIQFQQNFDFKNTNKLMLSEQFQPNRTQKLKTKFSSEIPKQNNSQIIL